MNKRWSGGIRAGGILLREEPRVLAISEQRYALQAQPRGVVAALRSSGMQVREQALAGGTVPDHDADVVPDKVRADLEWADVVVARGRSEQVLAALDLARELGVAMVDPPGPIRAVRDKARMGAAFLDAGIPVPATFIGPVGELAGTIPAWRYPLILKPVFGDNARGLRVVRTPADLAAADWPESPALLQSYLPGDGVDLKLYGIGPQVWAVRKPSPFTPCRDPGTYLVPLDDGLERLAHACAGLFGLTVYGVDCLQTPEGPVVIEINDFPNFTAVPDADTWLARHVLDAAGALLETARP
ncbi:RimK family alpha-L-glutamate ligase [Arthrobacter sp. GCM10027362]|uniref:ATP-grasp domain-containing protein n=1 Tax=Arthrobacter sp. GCM10027362 TaxID=3273379 RepID=UPI00363750AE